MCSIDEIWISKELAHYLEYGTVGFVALMIIALFIVDMIGYTNMVICIKALPVRVIHEFFDNGVQIVGHSQPLERRYEVSLDQVLCKNEIFPQPPKT